MALVILMIKHPFHPRTSRDELAEQRERIARLAGSVGGFLSGRRDLRPRRCLSTVTSSV